MPNTKQTQRRKTASGTSRAKTKTNRRNRSTTNAGNSSNASARAMPVTSRVVNVKRHTTGYVIGGKQYSVSQARNMARNGRVANVRVVGNHIQAAPGARCLSELPILLVR